MTIVISTGKNNSYTTSKLVHCSKLQVVHENFLVMYIEYALHCSDYNRPRVQQTKFL